MTRYWKLWRIFLPPAILALVWIGWSFRAAGNRFDAEALDLERVERHIAVLSSPEYQGRAPGSTGNRKAVEYIIRELEPSGIRPLGPETSLTQRFSLLVPQIDENPVFQVEDSRSPGFSFAMYEDYRILPGGPGAGIDHRGDMILVGHNLYKVNPASLTNRIVVVESILMTRKKIRYAVDHGAAGILFVLAENWTANYSVINQQEKILDVSDKYGAWLMVGSLGIDAYMKLKALVGPDGLFGSGRPTALIRDVRLKASLGFPPLSAENILGFHPGRRNRGRDLILSAALDGPGTGVAGTYFPGAARSAAGTALLLETARVLSRQEKLPYRRILFAFWNGSETGADGASFFLENPPVALRDPMVVHMGSLGASGALVLESDEVYGMVLRSRLARFAALSGAGAVESRNSSDSNLLAFAGRKIPGVILRDQEPAEAVFGDTAEAVRPRTLEQAALILLEYLQRDLYRDNALDFFSPGEKTGLLLLALWLLAAYLIAALYNRLPDSRVFGIKTSDLYFHPLSDGLRRGAGLVLWLGSALFLLVLIISMPQNGTVERINGLVMTNQSGYLILKDTVDSIRGLLGTTGVPSAVFSASLRSLVLLASAFILSIIIGLSRGIIQAEAGPQRRQSGDGLAVIAASIPDVVIVLAGIGLYLAWARAFPELNRKMNPKHLLLPVLTLSVLPSVYFSRICSITVSRESRKEYMVLAVAKGFSRRRVVFHDLLPVMASDVLDAIPTLAAMMLTNLIIVEYMFDYKGLIYYLLLFNLRGDATAFLVSSIFVGGLYLVFSILGRQAAAWVDPAKRTVSP